MMMADNSNHDERASTASRGGDRFNGFRWLDHPSLYQAAARQMPAGVIPVLAPTNHHRRQRWEKILGWYGLKSHVESDGGGSPPAAHSKPQRNEIVVGFDDEYVPAATLLAAATGRRLIVASRHNPLSRLRGTTHTNSIVFVGHPTTLHKANIYAMACTLEVPWGVLTASDLSAMSFLLAKQLADIELSKESTLLLDAPAERVRVFDSGATTRDDSLNDGERLNMLLKTQSYADIIIHAHGEGAHANLKSVVLCGMLSVSESSPGEALLNGCRQVRAKRFCKRASKQRRYIFSFGDLKARNLHLLSCNGFTVAKDLYPSDVSAVLAAVEGYPASVLTTDRSLSLDPRLPELILLLIRQGLDLPAIRHTLNQITMFHSGTSPFILCGDPFGSHIIPPENPSNGILVMPPRESARVIELNDWQTSQVIGLGRTPAEIALFRGDGLGVVRSDGTTRRRVKIEDFSERWKTHLERTKTLARRYLRVSRPVALIRDFWWDALKSSVGFQEKLEELDAVGRKLSVNIERSLRALEDVRREGVWDDRINLLGRAVERQVDSWGQCFAYLIESHILDCDLAPLFLHDELQTTNNSEERCHRCGLTLIVIQGTDSLVGGVATVTSDCPNCGPQELWQIGGVRFTIKGRAKLHPGKVHRLNIEEKKTPLTATDEPSSAYIIAQLQDLGGKPFFSEIATAKNGKARFTMPVPNNCSFDMQTLRIAWVQGLTVSAWRLPYPCVPDNNSSREDLLTRRG